MGKEERLTNEKTVAVMRAIADGKGVEDIKKDLAANKALDFVKEKANIKVENVTDEKAN